MATSKKITTPQADLDAFAAYDKKQSETPTTSPKVETPQSDIGAFKAADKPEDGRSMSAVVNVADSGTSTREDRRETTQKEETIKAIEKQAPTVPEPTKIATQAPQTQDIPQVTDKQEETIRRGVQDEYSDLFSKLETVGDLAAEGRTQEVDLYAKQANDIISLLDEQLGQF